MSSGQALSFFFAWSSCISSAVLGTATSLGRPQDRQFASMLSDKPSLAAETKDSGEASGRQEACVEKRLVLSRAPVHIPGLP